MNKISSTLVLLILVGLSGCSGTMSGMDRQSGERINIDFEDTGFGYGKLTATASDGEIFTGKFIENSSSASISNANNETSTATMNSGVVTAVLFGSNNHSMNCVFKTMDPGIGLPSGGVGQCRISDGRTIDIQF